MNDRTAELEAAVRAQDALIAEAQGLLTNYLSELATKKLEVRVSTRWSGRVLTRPQSHLIFSLYAREGSVTGAIKMPIRRYLGEGSFFTPTAVSATSKALVETTEILGIEGDEKRREAVARAIIRLPEKTPVLMQLHRREQR